jgi:hypothetical protein
VQQVTRGPARWIVPVVVLVAIVGGVIALRTSGSDRPAPAATPQPVVNDRAHTLTEAFANSTVLPADLKLLSQTVDPANPRRQFQFQYYPDQQDSFFSETYQASGELAKRVDNSYEYGFTVRIDHMDTAKLTAADPGVDPDVTVECGPDTVAVSCVQRTFPDGTRARVAVLPVTKHVRSGSLNPRPRDLDTELDVLWPDGDRMAVDAYDSGTATGVPLGAATMFRLAMIPGLR